jgi:hypothetical protein
MGDHKRHYRTVQAVSEGMMGGSICDCKGECKEIYRQKIKDIESGKRHPWDFL